MYHKKTKRGGSGRGDAPHRNEQGRKGPKKEAEKKQPEEKGK